MFAIIGEQDGKRYLLKQKFSTKEEAKAYGQQLLRQNPNLKLAVTTEQALRDAQNNKSTVTKRHSVQRSKKGFFRTINPTFVNINSKPIKFRPINFIGIPHRRKKER